MSLADQLEQFARERGGVVRRGPQPQCPPRERRDLAASTSQQPRERRDLADPMFDYTDDYSHWCRVRRGE